MSLKSFLFYQYSKWKVKKEYNLNKNASKHQLNILLKWIKSSQNTLYGKEYNFDKISSYEDFKSKLPLRNYEDYIDYIERIKSGEKNVLTSSNILYFLLTSGTTAGTKYIPISKKGIKHQVDAALKVLCFYAFNTGRANFIHRKMIFIQGSPELSNEYEIPCGRLSGVVYHHIPRFFQRNKLPTYQTNIISNWQDKINQIVNETVDEDLSIIGGIPPWCLQYFEKLLKASGHQTLKQLYSSLEIYIYGGLDFSSYRQNIQRLLGKSVQCLQTFPASEGFFGIQDRLDADDMLLLLDQGVFYEFKPHLSKNNEVIHIGDVSIGKRYELIITNNSGLYRYCIGDLIEFTSLSPYRIRVVGRTSHYISAFGEHVIASEIEKTIEMAANQFSLEIEDYFVCADIENKCYIWRIEWKKSPSIKLSMIAEFLDEKLSELNKYYAHLIRGKIIYSSQIYSLKRNSFSELREKLGKEGGQNKVIRLSNTQNYAKWLDDVQ